MYLQYNITICHLTALTQPVTYKKRILDSRFRVDLLSPLSFLFSLFHMLPLSPSLLCSTLPPPLSFHPFSSLYLSTPSFAHSLPLLLPLPLSHSTSLYLSLSLTPPLPLCLSLPHLSRSVSPSIHLPPFLSHHLSLPPSISLPPSPSGLRARSCLVRVSGPI